MPRNSLSETDLDDDDALNEIPEDQYLSSHSSVNDRASDKMRQRKLEGKDKWHFNMRDLPRAR